MDDKIESIYHGEGRIVADPNGRGLVIDRYEYNLTDHLGNVRIVFADKNGNGRIDQSTNPADNEILQENHYYPFGMRFGGNWAEGSVVEENRYQYNGKEHIEEVGLNDHGARWYDPAIARWTSVDPLSEAMSGWSGYNFVLGNPLALSDPTGMYPELTEEDYDLGRARLMQCNDCGLGGEDNSSSPNDVIVEFNRETQELRITDLDHYQEGLPTKYVSASDYVHGGIRDKDGNLTANQVLVIHNVFTGGQSFGDGIERNPNQPMQNPILEGEYDIVDNNADTRHEGWYRLDAIDEYRFNDTHDETGRNGFRFHIGTESWGCVTCDASQRDRSREWRVVQTILESTSTTSVRERRGRQWLNPFSTLTLYGKMKVSGRDQIPVKQN